MTARNPLLARPVRAKGGARSPTRLSPAGLELLRHVASTGANAAAQATAVGVTRGTFARILKRQPEAADAAAGKPTPEEVSSGPMAGTGVVDLAYFTRADDHNTGMIRALAREGKPKNFIADRLGLSRAAFKKLLATDEAALLAWEGGNSENENEIAQALLAAGRKGNVIALIYYSKSRLNWTDQPAPPPANQANIQIIQLPAAARTEQEYVKFIEANPLPQAALPAPPQPFVFEEAIVVTDDNDDSPDQIYRDPGKDPTTALQNAERLAARHVESERKRDEAAAAAKAERHAIATRANEERIDHTNRRIARESAAAAERLAAEPPPVVVDEPLTAEQLSVLARARGVTR